MSKEHRISTKTLNRVSNWMLYAGGYIYDNLNPNSLYNQVTNNPGLLLHPLTLVHEIPAIMLSHIPYLVPYAFGRLLDIGSTKWAIHQYKMSGRPYEDIPDYEQGAFHKHTLNLRYRRHKPIAAALSEIREEIIAAGAAALFPGFGLGYALSGPVIAYNNITVGNDLRHPDPTDE